MAAATRLRNRNSDRVTKHIDSMLHLAETAGCQLMPQATKPRLLRGLCPFHETQKLHTANTLVVNLLTGNFHCQHCKVNGTPTSFIALIWGVCLAEANRMLTTIDAESIQLERPTPLCMREPQASANLNFRSQNTSLLTRATDYFAGSVVSSPAALNFLTRLGIPVHNIDKTKVGYIKGWGLASYLKRTDTTRDELEQSPLFSVSDSGKLTERFRSALTMPDLDIVGATRWMLLIPPLCPEPGQPWPKFPPRQLHLRGQRPYLFGLANTPRNCPFFSFTDDPRIQLVMQAENIPSCHALRRQDAEKVCEYLITKEPKSLTLMLHNRSLAEGLVDTFAAKRPDIKVNNIPPDQFLLLLEPATRDLRPIVGNRRDPAPVTEAAS